MDLALKKGCDDGEGVWPWMHKATYYRHEGQSNPKRVIIKFHDDDDDENG
jgi:hypothetical protein